mmetsp:Transcript_4402/g.7474  ORF Transcript_4402/g.7474 Transcript_4402/m.7474 type:complete len:91 (+) Transcript_4402:217-489(+)
MQDESGKNKAELSLSHPFSVQENYKQCTYDFNTHELICEALTPECFLRGPFAKGKVLSGMRRVYKFDESTQTLKYDLYLGIEGGELKHHL